MGLWQNDKLVMTSQCGIHALRSFGVEDPKTVYENNANTITSAYHSHFRCTQLTQRFSKSSPEYHMTQIRSFTMTDTAEAFRPGSRALCETPDIVAANDRVKRACAAARREISVLDTSAERTCPRLKQKATIVLITALTSENGNTGTMANITKPR